MRPAATANVVDLAERRARRSPSAAPVHKLRVLERCRALIRTETDSCRELGLPAQKPPRSAISVLQYLAEITDKDTGLATARLRTIGEAVSYSRSEAGRALKWLIDQGLIARTSQRRGKECLAATFRLIDPALSDGHPRPKSGTTPSQGRDTSRARSEEDSSPHGLNPSGATAANPDTPIARRKDVARQGGARDDPPAAQGRQPSPGEIPAEIERALRSQLGDRDFETWIRPCHLVRDDGGTLILGAPSPYIRQYVAERFTEPIARATGRKVEVVKRAMPA